MTKKTKYSSRRTQFVKCYNNLENVDRFQDFPEILFFAINSNIIRINSEVSVFGQLLNYCI